MHKVITFGIPSYNAAKDMDHCITSILEGSNYAADIEIIIVDDGSKDETAAKADEWETRYPGIIRAVHQENGGHGIAVLSGLREAQGRRLGRLARWRSPVDHAFDPARF